MNLVKLGTYQHYKGKLYQVIDVARHHETLEEFVVYRALYNDPELGEHPVFIRPKKEFMAEMEIDGKKVSRFLYQKK